MKKILIVIFLLIFAVVLSAQSNWLGKDKFAHLTGSAFLTYWNYGVCKDIFSNSSQNSLYISISSTAALGILKEFSDLNFKQTGWSWKDLLFDLGGIPLGFVMINNLR